jgi:hypothetical protein
VLGRIEDILRKVYAQQLDNYLKLHAVQRYAEATDRLHHAAIRRLTEQVFPGHAWPPESD